MSAVAEHTILGGQVVHQLQTAHALKAGALRMFDPMLTAVAEARDDGRLAEVHDLLARMHTVFGEHREATSDHAAKLGARLGDLGAGPAKGRLTGISAGAKARALLGGKNYGANARDAFVFEHLEIATLHLLEQVAERARDSATAALARDCRAADEDMAATINRNWTNVLSLTLISRRLPTLRPPEDGDTA